MNNASVSLKIADRPTLYPAPKPHVSSTRLYYLRDRKNIQRKKDGTYTRGNPLALIASDVDFTSKVIRYQVAVAYQRKEINPFGVPTNKVVGDSFVKHLGRSIAIGRLDTRPFEILDADVSCGHMIILQIMRDIEINADLSFRARKLARVWLETPPFHKVNTVEPLPIHIEGDIANDWVEE